MLAIASFILHGIYVLLPPASLGVFATKGPTWLKRSVAGAWISGSLLAGVILAAYVFATGGSVAYGQIAKAIYFGVSVMLLLRVVDTGIKAGVFRLYRIDRPGVARWRLALAVLTRVIVFGSLALPWVMSAAMVYRPRVVPPETPRSVIMLAYESVEFTASDGTRLAGWYIPASESSPITAIVCHGLGSSKSGMWMILQKLNEAGINVLTIDLRAHAESSGQLTTFGATESADVIGAVDWIKQNYPDAGRRVVGVGASLGAAAIIEAAAIDPRIDAVATIGTFDSMSQLSVDLSNAHFAPPLNWLARWLAMPMASLHAGVNLYAVKPGEMVEAIWPRPVLIIHGANDEIIPFSHGKRLYDHAYEPREAMFTGGTHNEILDDPAVVDRVVQFVLYALSSPVI
jgi:fermentation-respiration switch protein FrsA (DUF1100 family)